MRHRQTEADNLSAHGTCYSNTCGAEIRTAPSALKNNSNPLRTTSKSMTCDFDTLAAAALAGTREMPRCPQNYSFLSSQGETRVSG